jgi:hypothetical protein
LSGSSPLTCLAWETLPVACATASIALGIIWPHKPRHYAKVGILSGGKRYLYLAKRKVKLVHRFGKASPFQKYLIAISEYSKRTKQICF